jgi:DNA polymerase
MADSRREKLLALKAAGIRRLPKPAGLAAVAAPASLQSVAIASAKPPARAAVFPAKSTAAGDHSGALAAVRAELGDCTRCRLCEQRTHIVFGVGDPNAKLMFIGEGPGQDEDEQGEPFVGRAGKLLTKIIEAMGLSRETVYIANIVKCRPPENRKPQLDEMATCIPFLHAQIAAIRPKVIVALGASAVEGLTGEQKVPITKRRGQFVELQGIPVMQTYHPSYILRQGGDTLRSPAGRELWEDMKTVLARLKVDG